MLGLGSLVLLFSLGGFKCIDKLVHIIIHFYLAQTSGIIRIIDPAKSKNPFAYFTQIIYFAFLRRIQKEKKQ
ncbi:MAG TPA: hypothetical protein EYN25_04700, partial [Candidatus Nitrosopelagicus sp.]|nr:hypothetical protein [Candidatus Nitrosopelagicus sp.]